jgi:hypothetical protein
MPPAESYSILSPVKKLPIELDCDLKEKIPRAFQVTEEVAECGANSLEMHALLIGAVENPVRKQCLRDDHTQRMKMFRR